ncbi:MAG: MBL fold metallo-hydrolase [Aeromicrobium sp.]
MKLTKHGHACVSLTTNHRTILIDPGTFTPDVAGLLDRADAVLVTHDHFDHFDVEAVTEALDARPDLPLFGPPSVVQAVGNTASSRAGNVTAVIGGEALDVAGTAVSVIGGEHAMIHEGIVVPHNTGYLVAGSVYHPGDAYAVPSAPVHTLLVPVSGPWVALGEAIDFIEAVEPVQTVQIHDVMLSDVGVQSAAMFLGEKGLTRRPMLIMETGQSIDVATADDASD